MNRNWIIYVFFAVGLALPGHAQLQFTNATGLPPLDGNVGLNAVAYDGTNTFVVVGDASTALTATFVSNATNLAWMSGSITGAATSLRSVAFGNGQFVAGGTKSALFVTTNGMNWTRSGRTNPVFTTSSTVQGLAFNKHLPGFAAASSFVALSSVANPRQKWKVGSIASASFLESYRGLTPYSSNGFAVSGIRGVIRVSRNGGTNWSTLGLNKFKTSKPDLFGIASDGAANLVAVGTGGTILGSIDGGMSWSNAPSTARGTTNYAVAFRGEGEFIVVGSGGRILTGSATTITNPLNSRVTVSLQGVAFATNGIMKGVAMVVGKNGTVLLGGTPPPVPINPVSQSICAGSNNVPLCVSIDTSDPDHPDGTITIDWYDSASGGTRVTNNTACFTPTNSISPNGNAPSDFIYHAQARDLRTGIVNMNRTQVTLTINPRPTSSLLSFNETTCNSNKVFTLTNTLTGVGPWDVWWNDGTMQTTNVAAGMSATLLRTVAPTNTALNMQSNNVYYVTNVIDANSCIANQSGDITGQVEVVINPRATVTATLVPFAATNCNVGASYTFTNNLTGIGPWTVVWNDGVTQNLAKAGPGPASLTRTVSPTNVTLNLAFDNVYYVTSVVDSGCVGDQPGDILGTNTITINPRPTSELVSFSETNCNLGVPVTLTNILTGFGPWAVVWSSNDQQVVQVVTNAVPGPFTNTFVVVPTNTLPNSAFTNVYFVLSVSNENTCVANQPGDISGQVTVTINPRPTSDLLSFAETNCNLGIAHTLTNILTGLGPWTVRWSSNGQEVVQTVPDAVPGPFTNTFTVIPTNTLLDLAYTNIYLVLSVSNDNTCLGNAPGDITGQVTVAINPRPTSELVSFNGTNCNLGAPVTLTNILTGLGPWTVVWSSNDQQVVQVVTNAVPGPFTNTFVVVPTNTLANATVTNTYFVLSVSNGTTCVTGQPGDITGQVDVTINPRPTSVVQGTNAICNSGNPYFITNILAGHGPWIMNWSDGIQRTNFTIGPGPVTNFFMVFPTNTFLNEATNFTYAVTNLTDAFCSADPARGDLTGTNRLTLSQNLVLSSNEPTNQTLCPGAIAHFSVATTGTGISYQWKGTNGLALTESAKYAGVTNATLYITNILSADAGDYSVDVVGTCGVTNRSASLTVLTNVSVTMPPVDLTVCPGSNAVFTVAAAGTGIAYQWRTNGVSLAEGAHYAGVTAPTLTVSNAGSADAVTYTVVVSGSCSSSNISATLTVSTNVSVTMPPVDLTVCPGSNAVFSVAAAGTGIAYQWQTNGVSLAEGAHYAGVTAPTLTVSNAGSADAVTYTVVVSGSCGGSSNVSAVLTVSTNVSVTMPPVDLTVCPGSNAVFSVAAAGTGIAYQWQTNGVSLAEGAHYAGVTAPTLTVSNAGSADAITYTVVVSGSCGGSNISATLTVSTNVSVTMPPVDLTVCPGSNAVFSVAAAGTGIAYQWQTNGVSLAEGAHYAGVTAPTLTVSNAGSADAITYTVVVSGSCGGSSNVSAVLTVSTNVSVTMPPVDLTVCPGSNAVFSVAAAGTGIAYQWRTNGVSLAEGAHYAGVITPTLTVSNVTAADAVTYTVVVSGSCGGSSNISATLTVITNVSVITPPSDLTFCPGTNAVAVFQVVASGAPLTYQWRSNGVDLVDNNKYAGTTTDTLSISNVVSPDAGVYVVVIGGDCISSARLTVLTNVNASVLTDQTVCPGDMAVFSTTASGTGPYSYQWSKDGVPLSETTSTLALLNVSTNDAGRYQTIVTGACGSVTNAADLTIGSCALAIMLVQNKVVLHWQGQLNLACTTNLSASAWTIMARGMAGSTNYWTNSLVAAPTNAIFRLSAP